MLDLRPAGLSSGQKQRVIARASFGAQPPVLLFDEPLSHFLTRRPGSGCDELVARNGNSADTTHRRHATTRSRRCRSPTGLR